MNATDTARWGWVISGNRPDHERLTSIYDAHVDEVYRYVHRLCLDHAIAEDVTQDVFLAALGRTGEEVTVGWLIRSARNRMIDLVRREATYREKLRFLRGGTDGHTDGRRSHGRAPRSPGGDGPAPGPSIGSC